MPQTGPWKALAVGKVIATCLSAQGLAILCDCMCVEPHVALTWVVAYIIVPCSRERGIYGERILGVRADATASHRLRVCQSDHPRCRDGMMTSHNVKWSAL